LDDHLQFYGMLPDAARYLVDEVKRSGLRGRGGGSFPAGVKMEAVARRRRSVVVVNGTEGEPVSTKDKTLLAYAPHLVIDGAVLAAQAVGAGEVLVCVDRAAGACISALDGALNERRLARLDKVEVKLATTPSRYLAGEESALVHWLNPSNGASPAVPPSFTTPRPWPTSGSSGVSGPTGSVGWARLPIPVRHWSPWAGR
jgi:NADH:ubiquinone oxidoreductase subunit F (NADH-binding)